MTPCSVWDLLQDEIEVALKPRPANSVTPEEFAAKANIGACWARHKLSANTALRPVPYRTPNGKRGVCYVPK